VLEIGWVSREQTTKGDVYRSR